ncbi:MAG: cytochrome c-type biogenesis protein CcmH [Acidobacteria bacterium]|nr:cytochrome c-type biogenesis protein CcmH [Acidobacteriota bacterium]
MKSWRRPLLSAPYRFGVALLLAFFAAVSASLAQDSDPLDAAFRRVSNRLLCQCGCNYMVLSCNHLECPSATYIRRAIRTSLEAGKSEDVIVAGFVEEYGVKILPEPPQKGFSWMAWIMPFLGLALGGVAVTYVLWFWKTKPTATGEETAPVEPETEHSAPPELSPALVEKYRAQIDEELKKE